MSVPKQPIRVFLAEDHHIVRQGLRVLLETEPNLVVVGEAANGLEILPQLETLRPQIVILDLMLPGLSGLDVTRQIAQQYPDIRVVILSMHADLAYVHQALRNGARAYVLKDSTATDLIKAIHLVLVDQTYLSPPLSETALAGYQSRFVDGSFDLYETLTRREREVLYLAAEGYTSPEIAEQLRISPRTAETHRANLMRKLRLRGQSELIRYAVQRGILPLDQ